jgi:hypothetical protein
MKSLYFKAMNRMIIVEVILFASLGERASMSEKALWV